VAARSKQRPLDTYVAKRDFTQSPEPRGGKARPAGRALSFCVQKHLASHLHYDFRLEHNGVLLSWAVPKGPSLNPADKRMAVHVEDHPVAYGDFEGVIPSGYGAGVVLLWDKGIWTPDPATPDVDAALAKGELKFRTDGIKLKGSWVLVRTRRQPAGGGPEQWLLIKHRDAWSGDLDVATAAPQSVKSFGDLPDILAAHAEVPQWKKAPPVRGGETGKLFKDVIARAAEIRIAPASPSKRASGRTTQAKARPPAKAAKAVKKTAAPARTAADKPAAALPGSNKPKLSNQSKILFPATGFTKGDLVGYYTRLAPLILPHLAGRAVTLKRYPDGVDGKFFFEKRCNAHRPEWINTVRVPGQTPADKTIDFCTIDSVHALVWAANLAAIELHVPLALAARPDEPTALIFDLDPGPPATIADCARIALRLRGLLNELKLASALKTSGSKGLHVLVPLNTPGVTFDETKAFARAVALTLERDDPKGVIASMNKQDRTGRVFVDWGQNDRNKTNACVFSVRAREKPSVSWPIAWEDLEREPAVAPVLATVGVEAAQAGFAKTMRLKQSRLPRIGR
jgi:bifunctional non-homologous end joining protein LigD